MKLIINPFTQLTFKKLVKMIGLGMVAVVVVGGVVAGVLFVVRTKPELVGLSKSASAAQAEADRLVAEINKLMSLPDDEKPTVATVSDAEKIKDQAFFSKAMNGDKVLIYTKAKKVILYRPSEKRIMDVGTVNIRNQDNQPTDAALETSAAPASFSIALYNGTSVVGITNSYDDKLRKLFKDAVIASKQSAAKTDYSQSFLVDIKGGQDQLMQQLAATLNLPIKTLPDGESKPEADVLVILGQDVAPGSPATTP